MISMPSNCQRTALIKQTLVLCLGLFLPTLGYAEKLYRWQEADGSLTFSPSPPPENSNIPFKLVQPAQNDTGLSAISRTELATSDDRQQSAEIVVPPSGSRDSGTSVASTHSSTDNWPAEASTISAASPAWAGSTRSHQISANTVVTNSGQNRQPVAAAVATREFQCVELAKRIMALENRMIHSVSNAEMDQAVLQISRYQKNHDRHCRQ